MPTSRGPERGPGARGQGVGGFVICGPRTAPGRAELTLEALLPRRSNPRPPAPGPRPLVRGSALLAVLWLSAALAAIAFSLSSTVRGETERASTAVDGLRSYYLASGAIERASLELLWTTTSPDKRK